MALTRWRALALLALACAAVAAVGPSSAFNWADTQRTAGANIATMTGAYNGITTATCNGSAITTTTCTANFVTNKGTVGQSYRLLLESGTKVDDYGMDSGAHVASGYTGWSAEKSVAQTATFSIDFIACGTLTGCSVTKSYTSSWTVEGQKAGTLDFTATKVQITVTYP